MSDLRKAVLGRATKRTGLAPGTEQNYAPVKWSQYFDKHDSITTESGRFHYFSKGNTGPIILCLHGGGYSGLTWSLFAADIENAIECEVVALDLRGHGYTFTDNDSDLSLETLANDVVQFLTELCSGEERQVVLVGHSMGGAVAVEAAYHLPNAVGLCVIDVVEGTALDALSSMQSILRGRPSYFKSLQHAIQWCYKGGQTHNVEAARVSMPGQIINMNTGQLAADECDTIELKSDAELFSSAEPVASPFTLPELVEEPDESGSNDQCINCGKPPLPTSIRPFLFKKPTTLGENKKPLDDDGPNYTWRIDLSKTEKFWSGWFKGLSQKFLDVRIPKVLLLANIHGLDTTLTVGQMQGKFQLQVLARSGHAIHEDQPQGVSDILSGYLVKQKIANPKPGFILSPMPSC